MPKYKGEFERHIGPFTDALRYKMMAAQRNHGDQWKDKTPDELAHWCGKELAELNDALAGGNVTEAMMEAVDVAVLAMMVWCRLLDQLAKSQEAKDDD